MWPSVFCLFLLFAFVISAALATSSYAGAAGDIGLGDVFDYAASPIFALAALVTLNFLLVLGYAISASLRNKKRILICAICAGICALVNIIAVIVVAGIAGDASEFFGGPSIVGAVILCLLFPLMMAVMSALMIADYLGKIGNKKNVWYASVVMAVIYMLVATIAVLYISDLLEISSLMFMELIPFALMACNILSAGQLILTNTADIVLYTEMDLDGAVNDALSSERKRNEVAKSASEKIGVFGVTGFYAGQEIKFKADTPVTIGRDNASCQLIVQGGGEKVSRRHCTVLYDSRQHTYSVTDHSSNGTFLEQGTRLPPNQTTQVKAGSTIVLGDGTTSFKLM